MLQGCRATWSTWQDLGLERWEELSWQQAKRGHSRQEDRRNTTRLRECFIFQIKKPVCLSALPLRGRWKQHGRGSWMLGGCGKVFLGLASDLGKLTRHWRGQGYMWTASMHKGPQVQGVYSLVQSNPLPGPKSNGKQFSNGKIGM